MILAGVHPELQLPSRFIIRRKGIKSRNAHWINSITSATIPLTISRLITCRRSESRDAPPAAADRPALTVKHLLQADCLDSAFPLSFFRWWVGVFFFSSFSLSLFLFLVPRPPDDGVREGGAARSRWNQPTSYANQIPLQYRRRQSFLMGDDKNQNTFTPQVFQ